MRVTRSFLPAALTAVTVMTAAAQETSAVADRGIEQRIESLEGEVAGLKRLKISGYIQGQYQWGQEAASMKVGAGNEDLQNPENMQTPENPFDRIGIRRGRVKFTYEEGLASAVFQLDITEKGVGFKDAYLNIKDPWFRSMALKAGVFDRPFGYEISYSSSQRESPERSTIFQTLFPDERDLGAMLLLQAPASSPWSFLKLEAGLFAGNGIKQETDSKRDFIGHLSAAKKWSALSFGAGISYYNGSVYQLTENVFTMDGNGFALDSDVSNIGKYAKREYMGFDGQFSFRSALGTTRINGEYLFGRQPGTAGSSKSPNSSTLPAPSPSVDTYIRDFRGGYVMLVQSLGTSPVSLVAKYDCYDPNTKVSAGSAAGSGTSAADIARNTIGVGALWALSPAISLTAYYEFNGTERAEAASNMARDLANDIFTLRLQYKF